MKFVDSKKIEEIVTMREVINTIEEYYSNDTEKDSHVPERLFINDGDNTAILMPSFFEDYYAAKVIGIAPGNAKIGEPTLRGIIVLFDRKRMKPLLLLDARTITAIRTGAVSGVGMKYMSSDDTSTVGVIGTGDQGWTHLQAACAVRPIKTVLINNRSPQRLEYFLKKSEDSFPHIEFKPANQEEILKEAELIITTSTSVNPVLPYIEDIDLSGKHFAGSGAFKANMQEIPDYIVKRADYISVDSYAAFLECGEMKTAKSLGYDENNVMDTRKLVLHGEKDSVKKGVTIFKSVGVAILDVLASKLVYEKLKGSNLVNLN
ncbi:ornithine cyclodeaminase family protein [Siminovitchia sp. 179-K 8D1 HS]|uniref:ornithine cyclodeaminase family protein n=1 Tax=Siminovitchia sp. 179-K 8D1 HS TaxID=3142385 RepID=UPI0039A24A5E